MNNLKLEIEGYAIDLLKLDDLANVLTLDFKTGLSDDNTFDGNTARIPLSIPATKRNKEVFENLGVLNASRSQSKVSKTFAIYVNNTLYRSGKCKFIRAELSSSLYSFVGSVYKIGLYFDTISFFEELANINLTTVEGLGSVLGDEYIEWATDIEAVAENGIAVTDIASITYIPVKYSVFLGVDNNGRFIRNDEFTPAIQLKTLLTRIMENVGGTSYTLNSTFLDTTYFRSIIMPLTAMEYPAANHKKISDVEINIQAQAVILSNNIDILGGFALFQPPVPIVEFYTPSNGDIDAVRALDSTLENWRTGLSTILDTTGAGTTFSDTRFTAVVEGSYEVDITVDLGAITHSASSGILTPRLIMYYPNGVNTVVESCYSKFFDASLPSQTITFMQSMYLKVGESVRFGFALIDVVGTTFTYLSSTVNISSGKIKIKPLQIYANRKDSLIIPKYMVGADWTALDVVKGITHAFNLEWYTDETTKTVYVEPKFPHVIDGTRYQGFYNSTPVDVTSKVDLSKKGEILETKNKERYKLYAYKEDTDATIEGLELGAVVGLNKCRYENTNYIEDATKVLENPYFRNVLMFKDKFLEVKTDEQELAAMPLFYPTDIVEGGDNNETTNEGNGISTPYPVMLFFETATSTTAQTRIRCQYIDNGVVGYNEASKGFITDYAEGGSPWSLAYSDIVRPDGTKILGLFNTFHAYDAVSQDIGNLVRCQVNLTALDLANWTFQYANWSINNLQFNVQSIEKFSILNNRSSRVDILEYVTPTAEDYAKVEHTELQAITTTNVDVP